jgi:hypothetical protein
MSHCKHCKYFKKADWSRIYVGWGWFGIKHRLFRVCGFCMDSNNPDFNSYAKANGRGIGKIEAIFKPQWCRIKKHKYIITGFDN